ncbi:31cd830f-6135-4d31-bc4e-a934686c9feb [Thermothielavioides terrestris]
MPQED